jgi:hypothetical protein
MNRFNRDTAHFLKSVTTAMLFFLGATFAFMIFAFVIFAFAIWFI